MVEKFLSCEICIFRDFVTIFRNLVIFRMSYSCIFTTKWGFENLFSHLSSSLSTLSKLLTCDGISWKLCLNTVSLLTSFCTKKTVKIKNPKKMIVGPGGSQDFSKGGSLSEATHRCSPSYISGLSRIIVAWRPILTKDKSRWQKYFTKKQI